MKDKYALILRGFDWDLTPDVRRTVDALGAVNYKSIVLCWDKSGKKPKHETPDGFEVFRFCRRIPPRSPMVFLWWPIWWIWILRHLFQRRYAIVHAMDFDTLVPVAIGKVLFSFKLVFDCRDSFGMVVENMAWPIPAIAKFLEKTFVKAADAILLTQGDLQYCAEYFGERLTQNKIVTQVVNSPVVEHSDDFRTPKANPLVINLSGHISPLRGANLIYNSFNGLKDVCFNIAGDIRSRETREMLTSMTNSSFFGLVAYDRALDLMDQCSLVWLHYDVSLRCVRVSSTNKMFEAMMLGKPYLTSEGTWMAELANKYQIGWAAPYGDVDALTKLFKMLNENPSLLAEFGERGRKLFNDNFRWSIQRQNHICLYEHILGLRNNDTPRKHEGWSHFIGKTLDV